MLFEQEYQKAREDYGDVFRVGMGAESIQELLQRIDLEEESNGLCLARKCARNIVHPFPASKYDN